MKRLLALFLAIVMVLAICPTVFAESSDVEYVTDQISVVVRGDAGKGNSGKAVTLLLLKGDVTPATISDESDIFGIDEAVVDKDGIYEFETGLEGISFDGNLLSDGHLFITIGTDDITDTVISATAEQSNRFFADMKIVADQDGRKARLTIRSPKNLVDDNVFVVVAQYDDNGVIIDANKPDVYVQNGGGEYELSLVPQDDAKYCKAFVWYNDSKPLINSTTTEKTPKNVLVIGNSFSVDSSRFVHKIAESLGIELNVYQYQYAASTVSSQYQNRNGTTADNAWNYMINHNEQLTNKVGEGFNPTLDEFLSQNTMDAVILQNYWGQTEEIAQYYQPEDYVQVGAMKNHYPSPGYEILANYIKEKQPDAKIYINSIWSNEQNSYFANYVKGNYKAFGFKNESAFMYDLFEKYNGQSAIDVGRMKVNGKTIGINGEPVTQLPVGYAVQYARNYVDEDGNKLFYTEMNHNDFYGWESGQMYEAPKYEGKIRLNRDGFHLSQIGRFLASCVWVEAITGVDVRNSEFRPLKTDDIYVQQSIDENGNTLDGRANYFYDDMDNATAKLIRKIAHEAVEKFYSQPTRGLYDPSLKF